MLMFTFQALEQEEALLHQNGNETPIADKYGQRSTIPKYRDER